MLKKALLASAIAASLPLSAMAMGPIDGQIYGKANVSIQSVDFESKDEDKTKLNSNASRFGIKGKSELSEGLYAIYKAEFEIYFDDGTSGKEDDEDEARDEFEQRNIYVGLTGDFGTLFAGKHDTVLKLSQGKVDLFGDLEGGDIKNWMSGETRSSNVVNYTSPKFGDFSASLMAILNEGSSEEDTDGFMDSWSAGVNYSANGLYLSVARDENVDSGSQEKELLDITRLVASYKIDNFTLGAIVQTAEDGDNYISKANESTYDEDSYVVSASYKLDRFTFKAQYGEGEYEVEDAVGATTSDKEEEWMQLGVDYKLGKKTKLFAYYGSGEITNNLTSVTKDDDTFGVGLEHKF